MKTKLLYQYLPGTYILKIEDLESGCTVYDTMTATKIGKSMFKPTDLL